MRSATVREWLAAEGLSQYIELFEQNRIEQDVLLDLTERDLQDLGIPLGDRKRLLKAIQSSAQRKPAAAPAAAAETVAPDAERRQLTVMFCDLAGSTELSTKLDPEALRDLMQAYQRTCREVIERYDGHIAQYLGDGVMVYFGWPRAHEDDAVRAIRAGLELTQAVAELKASAPIRARVGIHTGLVVVGETGQGDASIPKAAVGETPNIAARLQSLADAGSVVVSERTRALAPGMYEYAELAAASIKGVSEPLRVFRVAGARAADSRFEASRSESALTPLVGREEELALLLRRWQEAKEGEGQVVLIAGEPGIGKSRLTRALRERLAGEGYTPLRYQCSPYHVHSALYSVIEQLERAAGFARDDTAEQKLDKLEAVLAGSATQTAEAAPLLAALLSLPLDRYPPLNLSPQKQKEKTLEALAGQVEALARRQPVLMLYEDAHWIDPTTQECLDLLVPWLQRLPVLLIVTYRPEYTAKWGEQPHVTLMGLGHLGRRQGAELVARVAGGKALPAEVLEHIVAHTDGVPLFVEELTKSILESKLLREEAERYVLDGPLPALAIPTTLRDSLIARLDRLAPVREVAQIGACIGREFAYDLLAAVSPLKGAKLEEALVQLTASGLLFRRGAPPEATYTFKHALVQDAAYDSLLKSKRTQLHAQIAQSLEREFADRIANEPELLAHHFTQGGLLQQAVPYWVQAGQRALGRVALAEAIAHLTTALTVIEQLPASVDRDRSELEVRLLLSTAYLMHSGWATIEIPPALEPARTIALRLGEEAKLVLVLYYIWMHHAMRCEYVACMQLIKEIDALARSSEDSSTDVIARCLEALTYGWQGNFVRWQSATDRLTQAYDIEKHGHLVHTLGHDPTSVVLSWAGRWLYALGYPDRARQAALDQLELSRRLGHSFDLCWALTGGTGGLLLRGETSLARQWAAEARAIAQEHALRIMELQCVAQAEGEASIIDGDHVDGYRNENQTAVLWRGQGGVVNMPHINTHLSRALIGLERFEEAKALLDDALEIIDRTGHRADEAEVHRVLGELLCQQSVPDWDAAERSFLRALEVARLQQAKGWELRAAMSLARLWQSQGKRNEARELLAPIYGWFTEGFDARDLREAKALLEELS